MSIASGISTWSLESEREGLDATILERIASGDDSAVQQCLDEYGGLVWSIANRLCRDTAESEDATQEIFLEIWQKAGRYDPTLASEATFIATIARRRLIDRFRRRKSAPETTTLSSGNFDVASLPASDPMELADDAQKATACMSKLSEKQQEILTMSIHHGVSHTGISEQLVMPLGSVKSFARRALIQLRDCMRRGAAPSGEGSQA